MDIVIPYDGEGDSLPFVLRSIEKYFDFGEIFLMTSKPPQWIKNVNVINCEDTHKHNKDANLIDKVMLATEKGVSEKFMFWSDDQVLVKKWEPKVVRNVRDPLRMRPTCKWEARLCRTSHFLFEHFGIDLGYNFDSHVAQPMEREKFKMLGAIDYQTPIGFCICTLYFGMQNCRETVLQDDVKATFEVREFKKEALEGKYWIGFNDATYYSSVKRNLIKMFPNKSIFEK